MSDDNASDLAKAGLTPGPKTIFYYAMLSQGVRIPLSVVAKPMAEFLTAVSKMVIPLEGNQLMVTSMLMLNGPLRTELPAELVRPLNDKLVAVIYEKMPHPPRNLAAQDFRSADGTDRLGAARVPYAKSVIGTMKDPNPPPAEEVFTKLMLREQFYDKSNPGKRIGEKVLENPDGLSSLTFAYGTLVIHSVFNSLATDPRINDTSSFFDLSPLYGDEVKEQESVRNRTGRGMLAPDCFVDHRMLFLPPAAAALLIVFNRNHNWLANEIFVKEGEAHGWVDPIQLINDPAKRDKQDDEIFEIARLVNCMHFVNVVITDYVGGVMGRTIDAGGWPLNAQTFDRIDLPDRALTFAADPTKKLMPTHVSRGDGNLVSIEFNTLYRWHATLSEMDVKWAEDMISSVLHRTDFENLTPADYMTAFQLIEVPHEDPKQRVFAGLVRDPQTNRFNDDDISKLIYNATEAKAGMFRAHGTPLIMKFIDVRGIMRAREMGTCTMNEFREWLGLPRYTSFKEWNANDEVANAASELYGGDIDRLELYPGLHAEGIVGDGLPVDEPYNDLRVNTMRNGLLLDAVALIRGDRFFTTAFNPENYTPTGYADVQRDTTNKAYGGCVHKLLFRTLPNNFPENSVYSWFPMTTPEKMREALKDSPDWSFTRPSQ